MEFPKKYDAREYVKWHHSQEPKDIDLSLKLELLRDELRNESKDDINLLNEIFKYFSEYSIKEYKSTKNGNITFQLPKNVDFKTITSIYNKLWRSFKNNKLFIPFDDIRGKITDLIRTEIVGDTLAACKFLALKFNIDNIDDKELKEKCKKKIKSIYFEPEMKMASGYFAYHILITFSDNIIIEVQIYSSIIMKWRELSHPLYEITRVNQINTDFGSKESRLISLGHLFHLAECEIERLQDEFNNISHKKS